jgi:PAS domain S-box-containing protein
MAAKILDLIDFEKVDALLEGFNKTTGFVTAILDLQGNVLSKSGWRQICTEFHRVHPETSKQCTISDTQLAGKLAQGEKYHFYQCLNGLIDVAVPIIIKGEHIANLFSGQFFFEEPDSTFFKKQSEKYGFNQENYLKALGKVPVVSKEKVLTVMDFLLNMTQLISEMTFQKIEQMELNKTISESEEKYRYLFANNPQPMWIYDLETLAFLEVNEAAVNQYGYTQKEFLSMTIKDIRPVEDIPALLKDVELTRPNYYSAGEWSHIKKSGEVVIVEITSHLVEYNGRKARHVLVHDITHRKKAEVALRNNEIRLHTLIQAIPDLVWLKDMEGIYLSCNLAFEQLFGAKESEIIGKTDYDFVNKDLADFFRENDWNAVHAGKPTANEEWVTFANDGHRAILEVIKTPMYDFKGNLIGVLGIGRDITGRKLAEKTILDSREDLHRLLNSMYEGAYGVDTNGNCTFVNRAFLQMLGYQNESEILGRHMHNLIHHSHPDGSSYPASECKMYCAHQTNQSINVSDEVFWRKDGTAFPVEYWSHPIEKEGKVIGSIATFIDITERKLADKKLSQLNVELENLLSNLDKAVFSVDIVNNKMLRASVAHETVFGYPQSNFYNNPQFWYEVILPEDKHIVDAGYPVLLSGKNLQHEYRMIDSKGQIRWIEARMNPTFDTQGKLIRIDGIAANITRRKLAETELIEKEVQYRNLADSGMALIWASGKDKLCNYFNKPWLQFTGRTLEQELGNGWTEGVHPDDRDPCFNTYSAAFDNREKFVMEYRLLNASGEYRWISGLGTPNYNSNNEFIGFISHCFDITDHKQSEQELIKAKEKAEEGDRLKTAFLANMSHEVRTPLNSIIGFSELLADSDFQEDQKKEFIQQIITNGNNLLAIISDIMDISKLESGKIRIYKKQINVQKFVSSIKDEFLIQIEEKNLELKLFVEENSPETEITVDEGRFRQIFYNLLSNAIKFTQKGTIEIGYQVKDRNVEFYVRDTGIGISKEFHHQIFERFRQADNTTTRKYGGNGLGLAISKNLTELMGGKIWFDSTPCKGSTFYISFPCSDIK